MLGRESTDIYFVKRLVFPWLQPAPSSTCGTLWFAFLSAMFSATETAPLARCGLSLFFASKCNCRRCWYVVVIKCIWECSADFLAIFLTDSAGFAAPSFSPLNTTLPISFLDFATQFSPQQYNTTE